MCMLVDTEGLWCLSTVVLVSVLSFPAGLQENSRVVPVPLQYAVSLPQSAAHLQYLLVPVG